MNKNVYAFIAKIFLLSLLLLTGAFINRSYCQTVLTPGDIVIIGIKEDNPDYLKMLTMVDLTCGTTFLITDNQWNNSSDSWPCNAGDSESGATITVTSKVCAGSVIRVEDDGDNHFTITSSSGSLIISDLGGAWGSNSGYNKSGDNAFILQGTRTAPTFIYGLKNKGNWANGDCDEVDDTALPDALADGSTAVHFSLGTDYRHYNCTKGTNDTKANLLAKISNPANWTTSSINWNTSSCAFTITDPCTVPTHKAVSFGSSSVTQTSATISWSNCPSPGVNPGNTKVIVIARAGAAVATDPTSGSTYTASPVFGSGSAIGAGFVIYDGTGTTVSISNLNASTTYYFSIYEYSCAGNCYNTDDLPGSLSTPAPLPAELLYFHAAARDNLVDFDWVTLSEKNNEFFEIQASQDGIHFRTITTIKGNGNSTQSHTYRFSWPGNNSYHYFRLQQQDTDGSNHYSSIEEISLLSSDYTIFPVPATNELFINTNGETLELTLLDLFGKELYKTTSTGNMYTLDLKEFPAGSYVVGLSNGQKNSWKRFYK